MPELPEVQTVASQLNSAISGEKIIHTSIIRPENIRTGIKFFRNLHNKKIQNIQRIGKFIVFNLEDLVMAVHLRMTGQLLLKPKDKQPDQYVRAIIELEKQDLWFRDIRTFGTIDVTKNHKKNIFLKNIGIDPLSKEFTVKAFQYLSQNKKASVKQFLLNQKYISGIGNIYACEILFDVGINPKKPVSKLAVSEIKMLISQTQKTLKKAISLGGCSDNTYRDIFDQKGSFNQHLKVYRKKDEKCVKCTQKIARISQNGRSTYYCKNCQA